MRQNLSKIIDMYNDIYLYLYEQLSSRHRCIVLNWHILRILIFSEPCNDIDYK